MELQPILDRVPDWAKDIRLNLDSVINRSKLTPDDALGSALAAAFAARSTTLVEFFTQQLNETDAQAAKTAAALMGMNNVWYPYVEMAGDEQLKKFPPHLRMNAYAQGGGIDKLRFELFALAASIVGKCPDCIQSHYQELKKKGYTLEQLGAVGRIAAVVNATALILTAQGQ